MKKYSQTNCEYTYDLNQKSNENTSESTSKTAIVTNLK